jgi:hypothetical protein
MPPVPAARWRRPARAVGQRQGEVRRRLRGHPQRRVPAREALARPARDLLGAEPAQPQLVPDHQPEAVGAEAHVEQALGDAAALRPARLHAQDPPLRRQPVEWQVGKRRGTAAEPGQHLVLLARRIEDAPLAVDEAVRLERPRARREQREVLDEMGDPAPRQHLVGRSDAEHQRRTERAGHRRPERRDAVDLRLLDPLRHRSASRCPDPAPSKRVSATAPG